MPEESEELNQPIRGLRQTEMDFRAAEFPSDALSVKRLRKAFPEHFDGSDRIADGYSNNDFFSPWDPHDDHRLVKLTELISAERTLAAAAFSQFLEAAKGEVFTAEDSEAIENCKKRLESHYQFFKLADGPEAARLLILQVEEEGERQARERKSRGRA
jgi:hypothetical protein